MASYEIRPADAEQMSRDAARAMTDEVKRDAERVWLKLVELYNGGAHTALGYRSWRAYCAAEFQFGDNAAYRLLGAGQVMDDLRSGPRAEVHPNGRTSRPPLPTSEAIARELRPVHGEHGPEAVREAWEQTVEEFGPKPTAKQVREVVQRDDMPPPRPGENIDDESWKVRARTLADALEAVLERGANRFTFDQIDTAIDLLPCVQADLERLIGTNRAVF